MTKALIVVDVQNDFISGTLAVPDGEQTAHRIATVLDRGAYDYVVTTQDWHVDPGEHFSGQPDFIDTWPVHCKAGTWGAELSPRLDPILPEIDADFFKGQYAAAYSGFEGTGHLDDGREASLEAWLAIHDVDEVDIVGIATDYCVKATALDAVKAGFTTRVLLPYCAAVSPDTAVTACQEMADAGVAVVTEVAA